jgi:hypothetical protein
LTLTAIETPTLFRPVAIPPPQYPKIARSPEKDFLSQPRLAEDRVRSLALILFKPKYNRRPLGFVLSFQCAVEDTPSDGPDGSSLVHLLRGTKELKWQNPSP